MLKDLFQRNRSYRRFYQDVPVGLETLRELVELEAPTLALARAAQAPDAVASSGPVEVKEEERSEATEQEVMVAQAETDSDQSVTVYTICAR